MGSLRFRRSFKIAPGVRVNVGRRGVGVSAGVRGARVSVNSRGTKTTSVGIPGTGLSYSDREQIGQTEAVEAVEPVEADREGRPSRVGPVRTLARLVGLVCLLMLVIGAFEHVQVLIDAGAWAILIWIALRLIAIPLDKRIRANRQS